jgi:GNAT superfamily N-acetyltransferase
MTYLRGGDLMTSSVKEITFKEITPYWKMLWKDSVIRRKSGVLLLNGFDETMNSNEKVIPTFFGAFQNDKIVGVNSGYSPQEIQYRSRGLYVLPEYRRQGVAQQLLHATEGQGKREGKLLFWSMPRQEAINAYLKFGFKQVSKFYEMEYGRNCFVIKTI